MATMVELLLGDDCAVGTMRFGSCTQVQSTITVSSLRCVTVSRAESSSREDRLRSGSKKHPEFEIHDADYLDVAAEEKSVELNLLATSL